MLASKKLSSLLENRDLTAGAIFGSVIKHPKNISFLRSISASMELKAESLSKSELGAKTGTLKMFLRNHCWQRSNLITWLAFNVKSSVPNSREGRHACLQNLTEMRGFVLRRLKSEEKSYQPFFMLSRCYHLHLRQKSSHNSSILQDFCVRVVRLQQIPLTSIRALSLIENVSVLFRQMWQPHF